MITLEIWEEILWIIKGLSDQWGILFGVSARSFMADNNILAEEFCHLWPCWNMKSLPDSFGNLTNFQHMINFFVNLAKPQTHGFVRLLRFSIIPETNLALFLKVFAPNIYASPLVIVLWRWKHCQQEVNSSVVVSLWTHSRVGDLKYLQHCNK